MATANILVALIHVASLVYVSGAEDSPKEVQITDLQVPPHVIRGDNAVLHCKFDLNDQRLESVTWFLDGKPFYKYSSEENGILKQVFDNSSFIVDEKKSNDTTLVLEKLNLKATGSYKCKIHSDVPHFETDSKAQDLQVVVLPRENVRFLKTPDKKVRPGSRIEAVCQSPPSIPTGKVSFKINKKTVSEKLITSEVSETKNNLFVTNATLKMDLKMKYFEDGKANITCSSKLFTKESSSMRHVIHSSARMWSQAFSFLWVILVTCIIR